MTCYTLDIPRWRPALLNELMRSVLQMYHTPFIKTLYMWN